MTGRQRQLRARAAREAAGPYRREAALAALDYQPTTVELASRWWARRQRRAWAAYVAANRSNLSEVV